MYPNVNHTLLYTPEEDFSDIDLSSYPLDLYPGSASDHSESSPSVWVYDDVPQFPRHSSASRLPDYDHCNGRSLSNGMNMPNGPLSGSAWSHNVGYHSDAVNSTLGEEYPLYPRRLPSQRSGGGTEWSSTSNHRPPSDRQYVDPSQWAPASGPTYDSQPWDSLGLSSLNESLEVKPDLSLLRMQRSMHAPISPSPTPSPSSSGVKTPTTPSVDAAAKQKSCSHCHATSTPLWRREPVTLKPLCNACGLYLQQRNKLRPQELIDADLDDGSEESDKDATGPECSHCHTRNTSVWRRSKTGEQLCNACGVYLRLRGRERPLSLKRNKIKPRSKHKDTGSISPK
ncbi:uncharacterized protein EV420DRAFT_1018313 [Desarmillaria tabescens]|uniref:GATA-type domain-containing protein n=1 Tax=Armillaria tabescens TaxID=1929756 RepID=A0AA39JJL6_ARMTA|nr:uncharacterized protein EV420DRAFT_1018313 [Desarmillaria tabescens]KAK0443976.1 hypothetical protein EV420DRAFT_1018313 [Desarmillaria tabescens]